MHCNKNRNEIERTMSEPSKRPKRSEVEKEKGTNTLSEKTKGECKTKCVPHISGHFYYDFEINSELTQ